MAVAGLRNNEPRGRGQVPDFWMGGGSPLGFRKPTVCLLQKLAFLVAFMSNFGGQQSNLISLIMMISLFIAVGRKETFKSGFIITKQRA